MTKAIVHNSQVVIYRNLSDFPGYTVCNEGFIRNKKGRVLVPGNNGRVMLKDSSGKFKSMSVSRLVAENFVRNDNPTLFNVVGHFDGDLTNNDWTNLFWTNQKGVLGSLRVAINVKKRKRNTDTPVRAYNLITNEIQEFERLIDCSKFLGISYGTAKLLVSGKQYHSKGWMIEKI